MDLIVTAGFVCGYVASLIALAIPWVRHPERVVDEAKLTQSEGGKEGGAGHPLMGTPAWGTRV